MNGKKWLIIFVLTSVCFALLIGSFNYIVDPYGFFRTVEIKGFNQQKEGVRNNIRYIKLIEISLRKPKTILMGSSRVHDSINPESDVLKDIAPLQGGVYNYGIDMARIKEIKFFLEHAIKNSKIERLVLGLDFFMFNKYEKLNITYNKELTNRKINFMDLYFQPLFSIQSLTKSFSTIKVSNQQQDRREFLVNGYRPGESVFFGLKDYRKLHNSTNYIFLSKNSIDTLYYAKMDLDDEVFQDFRDIIKICKNNNIALTLYISPAHAELDGEGLTLANQYENFENWKREITKIAYNNDLSLCDFSGYNSITTEDVKTPMQYYWDSSHFKEKVGDYILEKILSNSRNNNIPIDFGVKVTPSNIENHLNNIRTKRVEYLRKNKSALEITHRKLKDALEGKKIDIEDTQGIF